MLETMIVTACIPADLGASDKLIPLFKAPAAAKGGKIKLVQANAHNSAVTSGTAAFSLTLVNLGSGGTVSAGTIGAAIGSTASHWAVRTPKAWTLDDTEARIDAGDWVGVHYLEIGGGNNSVVNIDIAYQMGG